jgi:LPPG:FO 2-phospho-L-lactate transferase
MNPGSAAADRSDGFVLALCGGVGGAKLALGLYQTLSPDRLVVAVNTGDDFEHLGLSISPDLDTVLYTLSGVADRARGWGRADETWQFMASLRELGGDTWFQLGDRDLAMHVARTQHLREGKPLSEFAAHAARSLGIGVQVLPMTDGRLRTMVVTEAGEMAFQRYFVERRCAPVVQALRFDGAERVQPLPAVMRILAEPSLGAVIICPSNPYLSIDPLLAMPALRQALADCAAPVVAVSPIIGGEAVKGPTAKIMRELGIPVTTSSIAAHYRGLIDALVIDKADAREADNVGLPVLATPTLMRDLADRKRLAGEVIAFANELAASRKDATPLRRAGAGRS